MKSGRKVRVARIESHAMGSQSSSAQRGMTFTAPGGTGNTMGCAAGGSTMGATSNAMATNQGARMGKGAIGLQEAALALLALLQSSSNFNCY